MFCSKCGKEIPEDTKFCNHCGAQQGGAVSEKPSEKNIEKKKNPKTVLLSLVVMLAVYLLGRFAIAPAMLSDKDDTNSGSNSQTNLTDNQDFMQDDDEDVTSDNNSSSDSSAYSDIFMSRNIVDMTSIFTTLDTMAFANVSDDGTVEKLEYAYEDDTIKEMVDVVYYPVSELTEDQKIALDNSMKAQCATMEEAEFCTVSYNMGNNYYSVTLHFTDLDKTENIQKLHEFGLLTGEGANKISMSETESNLISGGYAKK